MVRRWFGTMATLLAGAGLAWGQAATPMPPPPSGPPQPVQIPPATEVKQTSASTATPAVPVLPPPAPLPPTPAAPCDNAHPSTGGVFLSKPYDDHSRLWFQAEYLLWWIRPGSLPPVVGTAPTGLVATGTLPPDAIEPLFGSFSNDLDYREQSGLRLSLGGWFDSSQEWGLDASYFQLEQKTLGTAFNSGGDPVIGPVFFDPNTSTRNLILASLPNFASGPLAGQPRTAMIDASANNRLWGAEVNVRKRICAVFFADNLDFLMGFRHLQFSEGVNVVTDSASGPGSAEVSRLHIEDHLGELNQFYGPQIGLASHTQVGKWSFDAIGKLALGDMHEVGNINGSTFLTTSTGTIASNTGVLAEPTNIGRPTRDRFSVVPELTFNVGYQVIENVRLTLGYNFLGVTSLARAGDLVDGVDARQVRSLTTYDPTAPVVHPQIQQHDSRFWAQGFNFGIEVRY